MDLINYIIHLVYRAYSVIWGYLAIVILLELIYFGVIMFGIVRFAFKKNVSAPGYLPHVTCMITGYNEGPNIKHTIKSIDEQLYAGRVDIIVIIDGASLNTSTLMAAREMHKIIDPKPNRSLMVLPKWQRGGKVSSLNLGLALTEGEILFQLDGETSFDNDMLMKSVRHFADPNTIAMAGALRVRNSKKCLVTRLQGLEYLLSIHAGKTGLGAFGIVSNISGAFGAFRTSILRQIGGWRTGAGEDLDLTTRLDAYLGRHKNFRVVYDPQAIGHTHAPETWMGLFKQRMRWDGDLIYIYLRKNIAMLRPGLLGWTSLIFRSFADILIGCFVPLLIMLNLCYLAFILPINKYLNMILYAYIYYSVLSALIYTLFVSLISERKRFDLGYLIFLPFFGIFGLIMRMVSAMAILWSIVGNSHLDSSMAPWWVLRRGKH